MWSEGKGAETTDCGWSCTCVNVVAERRVVETIVSALRCIYVHVVGGPGVGGGGGYGRVY